MGGYLRLEGFCVAAPCAAPCGVPAFDVDGRVWLLRCVVAVVWADACELDGFGVDACDWDALGVEDCC